MIWYAQQDVLPQNIQKPNIIWEFFNKQTFSEKHGNFDIILDI